MVLKQSPCSPTLHVMDYMYLVKITSVLSRRSRSCSFCMINPMLESISCAASPNSPREDYGREGERNVWSIGLSMCIANAVQACLLLAQGMNSLMISN